MCALMPCCLLCVPAQHPACPAQLPFKEGDVSMPPRRWRGRTCRRLPDMAGDLGQYATIRVDSVSFAPP